MGARFRNVQGFWKILSRLALISIPLTGVVIAGHLLDYIGILAMEVQLFGAVLGLTLFATFLVTPPTKAGVNETRVPWYDVIMAVVGLVCGMFIAFRYPVISESLSEITVPRVTLSALTIALTLEAVRRLTGWILVVVGVLFLAYARYTHLLPGILEAEPTPWLRLLNYVYVDTNALFGLPLKVTVAIVLPLIIFGQSILRMGGGQFLGDLAFALMGKYRGGPAKAAILASAMFGTISGSAVANVVTTGSVTIPLMKRVGYSSHFAAAVEATASTAGVITPPIMGAAAFIMAEFLAIPYRDVVMVAIIPALLYYLGLYTQVDAEAAKLGLHGLKREEIPGLWRVMKTGWFFLFPLLVLIYALFIINMSPGKAGLIAAGAAIVVAGLRLENRRSFFQAVEDVLIGSGRAIVELGPIIALAGIILGVISLSGIGFLVSYAASTVTAPLVIILIIVAITSIILGMGMPATAVYILLAVLFAPALEQLGVEPLSAHLFILYYGLLSAITPPVCVSIFAAAPIAECSVMRAGFTAVRLAIVAYLVPFLFVYSRPLMLDGTAVEISLAVAATVAGMFLIAFSLSGHIMKPLTVAARALVGAGGVILLFPLAQFSLINPTPIRLIWVKLAVAVLFTAYLARLRHQVNKEEAWETEKAATG
jgi:TRAP transporter 4TM/12TM fusion protein